MISIMSSAQAAEISETILHNLSRDNITDIEKAEIIADGFARMEHALSSADNPATKTNLNETELRLTKEIEELKHENASLRNETEGIKREISALQLETAGLRKETEGIKREISAIWKEIEEIKRETAALRNETEGIKREISAIWKEIEEIKKETAAIRKEIEGIKERMHAFELKISKEIEGIKSDIKALEANTAREIAVLRAETQRMIGESENKLIRYITESRSSRLKWMVGLFIGTVVTISGSIIGTLLLLNP